MTTSRADDFNLPKLLRALCQDDLHAKIKFPLKNGDGKETHTLSRPSKLESVEKTTCKKKANKILLAMKHT